MPEESITSLITSHISQIAKVHHMVSQVTLFFII